MPKQKSLQIVSLLMICCLLQTILNDVFAQGYSRKSLTILMVKYSNNRPIPSGYYDNINVTDRYDFNNIGKTKLEINTSFSNADSYETNRLIEDQIYEERIPNRILKSILVDRSKGFMTVDVIQKRGLYNATDAEFVVANNAARGLDILKDNGVNLLCNIYFLIIKPTDFTVIKNESTKGFDHTLSGTGLLYQLDFDSAYMAKNFWEEFYFDSPNSTMMDKLMNHRFPLKKTSHSFSVRVSDLDAANTVSAGLQLFSNLVSGDTKKEVDESTLTRKSTDVIYTQLITRSIKSSLSTIETGDDDFTLRSSVFKARPLQSKIGKKEGVRADKLFEVSERVLNKSTGKITVRKVGYVRAKRVTDNRYSTAGKTRPSGFYRASSKKIKKGMELKEVHESGFMLGAGYNLDTSNILNGYYLNVEYITHVIPGLNLALDIGYSPKIVSKSVTRYSVPVKGKFESSAFTGVFTLRQSINIHRISITPIGGVYYSYLTINEGTVKDTDGQMFTGTKLTSDYTKVNGSVFGVFYGAEIGINLSRTIQLRGGYRFTVGNEASFNTKKESTTFPYDVQFSGSTITAGLRIARL